jgi:hypothetical protein
VELHVACLAVRLGVVACCMLGSAATAMVACCVSGSD